MNIKKFVALGSVLLMFTFLCLSGRAEAEGPWKWKFSMGIPLEAGKPMKLPVTVYFDNGRDRFYVADPAVNSLHSFNHEGKYINTFNPADQIDQPFGVVRDHEDVLWVTEKGRKSLTRIDLKSQDIKQNILKVKGREIFPDRLDYVDGNFYVLDKLSGNVVTYDKDLQAGTVFGCQDCSAGFSDFVVKEKFLWGLARTEASVYKYGLDGKLISKVKLVGELAFPIAIEVGLADLLYILDRHSGQVKVFDSKGAFKYSFLGKGSENNRLYYPEDLLLDSRGRLCVVDSGNGRVEVFGR